MRKDNRHVEHLYGTEEHPNLCEGHLNMNEYFLFSFSFLLFSLVSSSEENHYIINERCQ